tara:strand:+ start:766 stop:1251 length:486 start_codon:yes stop_codon:yes gene_type:complete
MTTTTLYRPASETETSVLIEQTLNVLVDMRVREEVEAAVRGLPDHLTPPLSCRAKERQAPDTMSLRSSLRLLLPSRVGIGERWFRIRFGWTDDEIAHIIILLRLVASTLTLRTNNVVLDGTAAAMRRDAETADLFVDQWLSFTNKHTTNSPFGGTTTGAQQ